MTGPKDGASRCWGTFFTNRREPGVESLVRRRLGRVMPWLSSSRRGAPSEPSLRACSVPDAVEAAALGDGAAHRAGSQDGGATGSRAAACELPATPRRPRPLLQRAPRLLAAGLLAGLALAFIAPVAAQAQMTSDLPWTTTMTVGASGSDRGYENPFGSFGSMGDSTFTHGGTEYTIRILSADDGGVTLRVGPDLGASPGLVLEWAGEALPLDSATSTSTFGTNRVYVWNATWLSSNASQLSSSNYQTTLTTGSDVTVRLRTAQSASTDATLSDLELEDASDDSSISLTPTFASDTTTYTASVANGVTRATVTPTVNDSGASVEYLDGSDAALTDADDTKDGFQVDLGVGDNVIKVKVTAEDDSTTSTYQVTVTRARRRRRLHRHPGHLVRDADGG